MKSAFRYIAAVMFLSAWSTLAVAQTAATDAKQFTKDGLSFSYPNGWTLEDASTAEAQQLNIGRADSEAQMRVFVYRTPVNTPERLAEARKVLVDPYVATTLKQFQQMGAKPQKASASTEIATLASEGVRINASLDGIPGAAEIYWGVVGNRLVVLTMVGPDKALKKASPAWDAIRTSIVVAEDKPTPKETPKPGAI